MKKFSKLLAMVLAVSMVLTMFVGAYTDAADIDKDKAEAVATVYNYGIMMGNDKGEFNPKDNLTRDEMAKILFVLTNLDQFAKPVYGVLANEFDDAAAIPGWSKNFVGYAAANNIIVGNDKNEVNALGNLSYIEAAIVLLRTLGLEATYVDGEDRVPSFTGSKWFSNALFAADTNGLLAGLDIADFKAAITREDVAVMIANAIEFAQDNGLKDAAGNDLYKLAAPVAGVVVAEGENDDEEATLVIDGVAEEILLGDLDIEELLGKKIEAVVEAGEVISYTVADCTVYEDVALGDVAYADEDEDVAGDEALVFGEDVVVEDTTDYVYYMFENGEAGVAASSAIVAGDSYQVATYAISEGVVSIFYAPFSFTVVDPETIKEDYDEEDGWTGEFFIDADNDNVWDDDELAIDGDYAELEDATTLVTKTIAGELLVIDTLDEVDGSKLTITKNSSGAYIVKLDGEEAIILDAAGEAWYYANQGTDAIDSMIVYDNLILAAVAAEVEEEVDEFFYALVKDWTEGMAADVDDVDDDDDVTEKINVVTITLVTEDGEVVVEAPATTAADLGLAKNTIFEVREDGFTAVKLYGDFVTAKDGEDMTIAGAAVEAADVAFVNLTDDAELADIEIAANGVITVDGAKVKYNTVKAFWIVVDDGATTAPTGAGEKVYVVVYDNTGDFGVYADILANQK